MSKIKKWAAIGVVAAIVISGAGIGYWRLINNNVVEVQEQQSEDEPFMFQRLPFDTNDVASVAPIGEFTGVTRQSAMNQHFAGNYRHYLFSKDANRAYNVYAPADTVITGFRNSELTKQFRMNFRINDQAFFYLDHIQSLNPDLRAKLEAQLGSPLPYNQGVEALKEPIPVKAGDVLGQTGLQGIAFDWGVMDSSKCDGILKPDHYNQDMCPQSAWDYLTDELKAQIRPLAGYWADPAKGGTGLKTVKVEPPLGKYNHDIKGTLSGAWFKEPKGWQNAFFVPDAYDPGTLTIRLTIPELSVFGVWNALPIGTTKNPDPAKVTPESGIVGYVLERFKARDNTEYGVLLVRANTDDTITVETVKNATSVPANPQFSSRAVTLPR